MVTTKHIIIPVGDNALQSQAHIMQQMPSSFAYQWMGKYDFVKEYLYMAKDGPYNPPVEVWGIAWDSHLGVTSPTLQNPKEKRRCISVEVAITALGASLVKCKAYHDGMKVHLILLLPPKHDDQPIPNHLLGMDDIHVIDIREEMSKAAGDMPVGDFFEHLDRRVAEVIVGEKQD